MTGSKRRLVIRGFGLAAAALVTATTLSGCGMLEWGAQFAPSSTPWTPTLSPGASATPSSSVVASPAVAQGKVTGGSLTMYQNMPLSGLSGTCTRTGNQLQFSMSSTKYADLYSKVALELSMDTATNQVTSVSADLGQDTEGFTRVISYSAAAPASGTSAKLSVSGQVYAVTGTGQATATRSGKTSKELIPITIEATCSL